MGSAAGEDSADGAGLRQRHATAAPEANGGGSGHVHADTISDGPEQQQQQQQQQQQKQKKTYGRTPDGTGMATPSPSRATRFPPSQPKTSS